MTESHDEVGFVDHDRLATVPEREFRFTFTFEITTVPGGGGAAAARGRAFASSAAKATIAQIRSIFFMRFHLILDENRTGWRRSGDISKLTEPSPA